MIKLDFQSDRKIINTIDKEVAIVLIYFLRKKRRLCFLLKDEDKGIYNIYVPTDEKVVSLLTEFKSNYEKIREECFKILEKVKNPTIDDLKFLTKFFLIDILIELVPMDLNLIKIEKIEDFGKERVYYLKDIRSVLILIKYFKQNCHYDFENLWVSVEKDKTGKLVF